MANKSLEINQCATNQARSSLYLAEHRHHWAACWGPWESHMGIPGEDRWAGRRFPCIQVLQPPCTYMGCGTQCVTRTCALLYTRYPTHSCGRSTACVTTIQLHPLISTIGRHLLKVSVNWLLNIWLQHCIRNWLLLLLIVADCFTMYNCTIVLQCTMDSTTGADRLWNNSK